jgi:hypothetical protein
MRHQAEGQFSADKGKVQRGADRKTAVEVFGNVMMVMPVAVRMGMAVPMAVIMVMIVVMAVSFTIPVMMAAPARFVLVRLRFLAAGAKRLLDRRQRLIAGRRRLMRRAGIGHVLFSVFIVIV